MRNEMERDFQMDAIEVTLAQLNRRMARMEEEKRDEERESRPSLMETMVSNKMNDLEKKGKKGLASLLGIGFAVVAGLGDAFVESDNASPLVSSEARKWL